MYDFIPARLVLAILCFFGFINLYLTRFSFSVISVAMITKFRDQAGNFKDGSSCLDQSYDNNSTEEVECSNTDMNEINQNNGTLDWDERTRALVLGMFNYGYCLTQILGGRLAEQYGTKFIFGASIVSPAFFHFLIPVAAKSGYFGVVVLRFLQGIVQGVTWPAMNVLMAQWIPPNERSRYMGIVALGATFGMIFILPLSGFLCDTFSWEAAFYITGTVPLIWGVFWFTLMHTKPHMHPRIAEAEKNHIELAIAEGGTREVDTKFSSVPWKSLLTSLPFIGSVVCDFGNSFGLTIYSSQMPNYLGNVFHYSVTKTGIIAGLPFLFRYCGSCLFSSLADYFISRKFLSVTTTRRIFSAIAMYGPSIVMLTVILFALQHKNAFIVLICVALFFNGSIAASQLVNCVDIGPNYAGTLFGISNTFSSASSFICLLITGEILQEQPTLDSWKYVFWLCIPVMVVTETFYLFVLSGEPQPWNFHGVKKENEEQSTGIKKDVTAIEESHG